MRKQESVGYHVALLPWSYL